MQVSYAQLAELMKELKREAAPKLAGKKEGEPKEYITGPSFAELKVIYSEALSQAGLA